jgi:hypothetical protein
MGEPWMRSGLELVKLLEGWEGNGRLTLRRMLKKQDASLEWNGIIPGRHSMKFICIICADPPYFATCLLLANNVYFNVIYFLYALKAFPKFRSQMFLLWKGQSIWRLTMCWTIEGSEFDFRHGKEILSFSVYTGSGDHPADCEMNTGSSFPRVKVAGAWSWPLIPNYYWD